MLAALRSTTQGSSSLPTLLAPSLSQLAGLAGSGAAPACNGLGATPPATIAEFTLGNGGGQDFYDVNLVDGYNVAMLIEVSGGSGMCASTGCSANLNRQCPTELRIKDGKACKSACEAFGSPEYCCSGAFKSLFTCRPSLYSKMFKAACPRSYSYAYDDKTSTFTCSGADYTVTFCRSSPTQKTTSPTLVTSTATTTTTTTTDDTSQGSAGSIPVGMGFVYTDIGSGSEHGSESNRGTVMADETYLAGLAMGVSSAPKRPYANQNSVMELCFSVFPIIARALL
ncbi:hypothetical protein MLD38_026775 [Melastoma candidum]|uniref:Uncharacterized protein n=1 Tax=Melastoma candidum TaxID=119954 RepID=A0ACB9NZD8_9MYRT|nr:hypothetical protein MLD38_026775 [Melastoma candidum]